MSPRTLVSLAGSMLITASIIASLAFVGRIPPSAPSTIDGLPVTNLPGITVHPTTADATAAPSGAGHRTLAVIDGGDPLQLLIKDAAAQVTSSHLGMPYYSFGSGIGQISKD